MFILFGISHLIAIFAVVVFTFTLSKLGSSHSKLSSIIGRVFGVVLLSFYPIFLATKLYDGTIDIRYHLPLQISNFILIWLGLALLVRNKILYTLALTWGVPGAIVSMSIPDIKNDFPHNDYIFFWISHGILFGIISVLIQSRKYELLKREMIVANGFFVGYIVITVCINRLIGSNYGYLSSLPDYTGLSHLPNYLYIPLLALLFGITSLFVIQCNNVLIKKSHYDNLIGFKCKFQK